LRPM
jgi:hypothetical protein